MADILSLEGFMFRDGEAHKKIETLGNTTKEHTESLENIGNKVDELTRAIGTVQSGLEAVTSSQLKNVITVPTSISADELNAIIASAEQYTTIQFDGMYVFDKTINIDNKDNISIVGLGKTHIASSAMPALIVSNCDHTTFEGFTFNNPNDPGTGGTVKEKYVVNVISNTFLIFRNVRVVGARYGFHFRYNVDCNFEYLQFHIHGEPSVSSSIDSVGYSLFEGNNSSRFVQLGCSMKNDKGTGYYLYGDNTRDLLFENCESDHTSYGVFIDATGSPYLNNIHFNNCYWDRCSVIAIRLNVNDNASISFDNCYVWNASGDNQVAQVNGSGVSFDNCELRDGKFAGTGNKGINITNCRLLNVDIVLNNYNSLYACGNVLVLDDNAVRKQGHLLNGVSGAIIGDSIYCEGETAAEWSINTNAGVAHNLFICGVRTIGNFEHHYFTQAAFTDIV